VSTITSEGSSDAVSPAGLSGADLGLVEVVRGICQDPKFLSAAVKADADAAEPVESIRALGALGLNHAAVPAGVGGGGMSATTLTMLMEEIAAADASAAVVWNMQLASIMYLSLFPPFPRLTEVLDDMRQSDRMCCGGFSAPLGELDIRKAGFVFSEDGEDYVVSGRGGFATGSEGATYYFLAGRVDPAPEGGKAVLTVCRINEPGIKVMDNWDAMGLRGTASHDVKLDRWRVNKQDVLEVGAGLFSDIAKFIRPDQAYILQAPHLGLMGCMVGICRALHDALVSHLERRFGRGSVVWDASPTMASSQAWAHHRLGTLDHMLATTRVMVLDCARQIDSGELDFQETQQLMARTVIQAKSCVERFVVGTSHLGGAHGYAATSPLSRLVRDALGFNAMVWRIDELAINLGGAAFGHEFSIGGIGGT
jgi:alkylation response protein AidB-like acyl-CoA dehydrogenase